jgi:serine/threonine-protein kinase
MLRAPVRAEVARSLIFGILALRLGLITRPVLFQAARTCGSAKDTTLQDLLHAEGHLSAAQVQMLQALTLLHWHAHAGSLRRSIEALKPGSDVCQELYRSVDIEFETDPEAETLSRDAKSQTIHIPSDIPQELTGGRYQIVRPLAHGGLGEVFVARDQELHRDVALKEIRTSHADDPASRKRFMLEAEISGSLEHPGIVPIYGLGQYENGRPFYAMRLIRGQTLKDAIACFHAADGPGRDAGERSLAFRQLLSRFISVCNTVAYAHSRGVLHRDLKPSNILLGNYGETLVVDWGLAKVMSSPPAEVQAESETALRPEQGDPEMTEPGQIPGTPVYMSPEQALGPACQLQPASDIYCLGATLYTLLTGKPPFHGVAREAILQRVQRGDLERPRSVKPAVPVALEAVCLKATALEPKERYATGLELAADLEHWMADEPVGAWREPLAVRFTRWLRRHRAAVLAGVAGIIAAALCLAVATVLLTAANERERKANAKSQDRSEMALEVIDWFTRQISDNPELKTQNLELLRHQMLNQSLQFYKSLAAEETDAASVRVRAERGRAFLLLSNLQDDLGKNEEAVSAAGQARDIFAQLSEEDPKSVSHRRLLARSYYSLGWLYLNETRYPQSDEAWDQAVRIQRDLCGPNLDPSCKADLAKTYADWGLSYYDRGRYGDAEQYQLLALNLRESSANHQEGKRDLAESHINLGNLYRLTGRQAEAYAHVLKALHIAERLYQAQPNDPKHQLQLAIGCYGVGLCLYTEGRGVEARAPYDRAIALLQQLVAKHPYVLDYREELARTLDCQGVVFRQLGEQGKARAANEQALGLCAELARAEPRLAWYKFLGSRVRHHLAILDREAGQLAESRAQLQQALEPCKEVAREHPDHMTFAISLGSIYSSQGDILGDLGQTQEALKCYEQAINQLQAVLANDLPQVERDEYLRLAQIGRAVTLARSGRLEHAEVSLPQLSTTVPSRLILELRLGQLLTRAYSGDHVRVVNDASALTREPRHLSGRMRYDLARAYAVCSRAVNRDASLAKDKRDERAAAISGLAMRELLAARSAGYFQSPSAVKRLETDGDLEVLRPGADYRKLLLEVHRQAKQ